MTQAQELHLLLANASLIYKTKQKHYFIYSPRNKDFQGKQNKQQQKSLRVLMEDGEKKDKSSTPGKNSL